MPFNVTRTWESTSATENAERLADAKAGIEQVESAVRSALVLTTQATTTVRPSDLEQLRKVAELATAANSAIAEAYAEHREAGDVVGHDQTQFETHLRAASANAGEAYRLADLAIERLP